MDLKKLLYKMLIKYYLSDNINAQFENFALVLRNAWTNWSTHMVSSVSVLYSYCQPSPLFSLISLTPKSFKTNALRMAKYTYLTLPQPTPTLGLSRFLWFDLIPAPVVLSIKQYPLWKLKIKKKKKNY